MVVQSKAAFREAIEEIGGLEVDDVDDTCNEIGHALDKGTYRSNWFPMPIISHQSSRKDSTQNEEAQEDYVAR